jgi:hypothetical protein
MHDALTVRSSRNSRSLEWQGAESLHRSDRLEHLLRPRAHEHVVREIAPTASRGRLVQRVLMESLIVSVAGTTIGLGLAWLGVRMLAATLPDSLARVATIGIDARVLAVAGVAALARGLISGVTPALQGSNPVLSTAPASVGRGIGGGDRAGDLGQPRLRLVE